MGVPYNCFHLPHPSPQEALIPKQHIQRYEDHPCLFCMQVTPEEGTFYSHLVKTPKNVTDMEGPPSSYEPGQGRAGSVSKISPRHSFLRVHMRSQAGLAWLPRSVTRKKIFPYEHCSLTRVTGAKLFRQNSFAFAT